MRIAYLLKMFPRFSETFILNEILELERQGADLRIYSLKKPDDGRFHADLARLKASVTYAPEGLGDLSRTRRLHGRVLRRWPVPYRSQAAWTVTRRRRNAYKRFNQAAFLADRMAQDGVQHVHAHFASSATSVAWSINQLSGIPYSFTAHAKDIFRHDVSRKSLGRKLGGARFAVTVSDFNQRYLSDLPGAERLVRIYNGLDLGQFSRNGQRASEPPLLLGVGRLVEKKGFEHLVTACRILDDEGVSFRCAIVGQGDRQDALRAQVLDFGLADRVSMPGPLPRQALLDLYPTASVFAAPCVIGADGNRDGLPTVLIEAMALRVPVVSTPVTGIPELVADGETGLLVPEADPVALAHAMRRLIDDANLAQRLTARGRQRVEAGFDLSSNVSVLHRLFEGGAPGHVATAPGPVAA